MEKWMAETGRPTLPKCPWCHVVPEAYGVPVAALPGSPLICAHCGRWSLLTEDQQAPLIRAGQAWRNTIRAMPQAAKLRGEWKARHPVPERGR
jgi:hypothetical protein